MGKYVSNRTAAEDSVRRAIEMQLRDIGDDVVRDVIEQFSEPKSGRLYGSRQKVKQQLRRMGKSRDYKMVSGVHRASAPGEAPAVWSSALRKSIRRVVEQIGHMDYAVAIGTTIQGGRGSPQGNTGRSIDDMLEFGTTHTYPRPHWRVALKNMRQRLALGKFA